jgi:hypothetical protein
VLVEQQLDVEQVQQLEQEQLELHAAAVGSSIGTSLAMSCEVVAMSRISKVSASTWSRSFLSW